MFVTLDITEGLLSLELQLNICIISNIHYVVFDIKYVEYNVSLNQILLNLLLIVYIQLYILLYHQVYTF